jgi:hypothetical protein
MPGGQGLAHDGVAPAMQGSSSARSPNALGSEAPQVPSNAACRWLHRLYEDLDEADRRLIDNTLRHAKLINKSSPERIRLILDEGLHPTDKLNGSTRITEPFEPFQGYSATLVARSPHVVTFNWKDQRFYGVILNPDNTVPIVAGNRDLSSGSWHVDYAWRTPQAYNNRPVANVSPDGDLCHEMLPTLRRMALDMHQGDENLPFEKGRLLTHNEIIVGQPPGSAKPVAQGLFVDLTSNDFIFRMALQGHYPHLRLLAKVVPLDTWMQALQAMNIKKLSERPGEFEEIRRICTDHKLPFYVRSAAPDGKVEFMPIDLEHTPSIEDLAQRHGLPDAGSYPMLLPILEWISGELHSL